MRTMNKIDSLQLDNNNCASFISALNAPSSSIPLFPPPVLTKLTSESDFFFSCPLCGTDRQSRGRGGSEKTHE